jgi:hypothetical protein
MPNHVYSVISLDTLTKEQEEILKKIEEAEGLCRYYKPMPKELENTTSPSDEPNWYDWRIKNWGTKWGCYQLEINSGLITFTSAWSPIGDDIIEMFAKDFPNFVYSWEEEQEYGSEIQYSNGELVEENSYDSPQWDVIEDSEIRYEDGTIVAYELTRLCEPHPNYDDGVGYYADFSRDFLGRTLEEVEHNFPNKLKK